MTGVHPRAVRAVTKSVGVRPEALVDDLASQIGNPGAAQRGIVLADVFDRARPGEVVAVVSLADGADVGIVRTHRCRWPAPPPAHDGGRAGRARAPTTSRTPPSSPGGASCTASRRAAPTRPPRGPAVVPARDGWKFGFTGSRCEQCGTRHLPPARVCAACGAVDRMSHERLADSPATVATFTIDRLAYSLNPPVVAAVVDFDGGGRFRCELTDVDPATVAIGDRVEMTFRKISTANGVHNYFWKARPRSREEHLTWHREGSATESPSSGMGCTNFGEHWDKAPTTCSSTPATAAFTSAGIAKDDVDAYWLGTMGSGISGLTLSRPLKIDYKPVTRVENMCATGSEAFRNACYAVASGAYDMAMAIGVEKLKDSRLLRPHRQLPAATTAPAAELTAPASFSLLAPAYAKKYGVDPDEMKDVLTRIAWKNHKNGALNPRAQFRKEVPEGDVIACSPIMAGQLGIFDCSGVSRRLRRRDDRARRGRPPATPTSPST